MTQAPTPPAGERALVVGVGSSSLAVAQFLVERGVLVRACQSWEFHASVPATAVRPSDARSRSANPTEALRRMVTGHLGARSVVRRRSTM